MGARVIVAVTVLGIGVFVQDALQLREERAELGSHLTSLQRVGEKLALAKDLTGNEWRMSGNTALTAVASLRDMTDRGALIFRIVGSAKSISDAEQLGDELVGLASQEPLSSLEIITITSRRLVAACRTARTLVANAGASLVLLTFPLYRPVLITLVVIAWSVAGAMAWRSRQRRRLAANFA
jgi:hypothetical protein